MEFIDLSIEMFDNMPSHYLFPRPIILPHRRHEDTVKTLEGGFSYATSYFAMIDHAGTHVDAAYHIDLNGGTVDQMPLEKFYGPGVVFDLRHIPPKGLIDVKELEEAQEKSDVSSVEGYIVCLNTGHHNRTWPDIEAWETTYPGFTYEATK